MVEIAASRFRAPRNDMRGVRAPRGDKGSSQCTGHSPQFRSGNIARGVAVFGRDCRVALRAPRGDKRGVRSSR
ncbi:MAG: hypothetical protein LBL66_01510 [Clostridiales bacterium]|nr:hypothetical protein [Clostridiales bacterium]